MLRLSAERWHALSPYLDRALDSTDAELAVWRESLRAENRSLADDLDVLLAELAAARRERFLED